MTWFDLISKGQGGKKTSKKGIEYVNNLMADGEARSVDEILDKLFEEKERGRNSRWYRNSASFIPTRRELTTYLSRSRMYGANMPEYSSGYFDKHTDVPSKKGNINAVIKFWLKK